MLTLHSGTAPHYLRKTFTLRRLLARITCALQQCVVAVNNNIYTTLLALDIPSSKLEVMPAYLQPPTLTALPPATERVLQNRWPILTTTLFFRPEYGFESLVMAASSLRSVYPKLRWIVIGSGEQAKEARQLVHGYGLQDTVTLLGDVPHDVCLSLISRSDIFARVNLADADSISVREALALGVPTVASNVGTRPPGSILFEAGSVIDLVSKIRSAVTPGKKRTRSHSTANKDWSMRLLDLYAQTHSTAWEEQPRLPTPVRETPVRETTRRQEQFRDHFPAA
jgi:glycosyltransferase involved in cell wall biosynthesis